MSPLREQALERWNACVIRPECVETLTNVCKLIMAYKTQYYDPASLTSGVPWYVIGALDCRESDFDHTCYLGNGDPLNRPTVDVPAGRGPFSTWAAGAADSLTLDNWNILTPETTWSIDTILLSCEEWNGLGYRERGLPSPYVWALTNQQVAGKYVADGEFSVDTWDTQPGCAGIFKMLSTMGVTIGQ